MIGRRTFLAGVAGLARRRLHQQRRGHDASASSSVASTTTSARGCSAASPAPRGRRRTSTASCRPSATSSDALPCSWWAARWSASGGGHPRRRAGAPRVARAASVRRHAEGRHRDVRDRGRHRRGRARRRRRRRHVARCRAQPVPGRPGPGRRLLGARREPLPHRLRPLWREISTPSSPTRSRRSAPPSAARSPTRRGRGRTSTGTRSTWSVSTSTATPRTKLRIDRTCERCTVMASPSSSRVRVLLLRRCGRSRRRRVHDRRLVRSRAGAHRESRSRRAGASRLPR